MVSITRQFNFKKLLFRLFLIWIKYTFMLKSIIIYNSEMVFLRKMIGRLFEPADEQQIVDQLFSHCWARKVRVDRWVPTAVWGWYRRWAGPLAAPPGCFRSVPAGRTAAWVRGWGRRTTHFCWAPARALARGLVLIDTFPANIQ